jgi:DNA-binding winged helix-turn-helix (wHTH) protein/Tol biopolymer transport system component
MQHTRYYDFDDFRLDARERTLFKQGTPVAVTHKVFDLLLVLVQNNGEMLTKDELLAKVWQDAIVEEGNLKTSISILRKALGETAGENQYIQTLPKRGYRFNARVRVVEETSNGFVVEKFTTSQVVIEEEIIAETQSATLAAAPGAINQSSADPAIDVSPEISRVATHTPKRQATRKGVALVVVCALVTLIAAALYFVINQTRSKAFASLDQVRFTRLTANNLVAISTISPDGKYFAYALIEQGKGQSLYVQQVSTGSSIQLLSAQPALYFDLRFTPDGNEIYYISAPSGTVSQRSLYQIAALGGTTKKILDNVGTSVSFSADGKQMLYVKNPAGNSESVLCAANLDGSHERVITQSNASINYAQWSPDGKQLAYSSFRTVDTKPFYQVYTMPAAGGEEKPLSPPFPRYIYGLGWLPESDGLLISLLDPESERIQLWQLAFPDGQLRRLTNDLSSYKDIRLTADGSAAITIETQAVRSLGVAPLADVKQVNRIASESVLYHRVEWLPDGKVVYVAQEIGKAKIKMMEADGSGARTVTELDTLNYKIAVSPDGRYLIYPRFRSNQPSEIWRVDIDGSNPKLLLQSTDGIGGATISADNHWVVYWQSDAQAKGFWKIPIDGGEAIKLFDATPEYFALSPDGKMIACTMMNAETRRYDLEVRQFENGGLIKSFPNTYGWELKWTKDSRNLLYLNPGNTKEIMLRPMDDSAAKPLARFDENVVSYDLSGDGKQFAVVFTKPHYNAVLIEATR